MQRNLAPKGATAQKMAQFRPAQFNALPYLSKFPHRFCINCVLTPDRLETIIECATNVGVIRYKSIWEFKWCFMRNSYKSYVGIKIIGDTRNILVFPPNDT